MTYTLCTCDVAERYEEELIKNRCEDCGDKIVTSENERTWGKFICWSVVVCTYNTFNCYKMTLEELRIGNKVLADDGEVLNVYGLVRTTNTNCIVHSAGGLFTYLENIVGI